MNKQEKYYYNYGIVSIIIILGIIGIIFLFSGCSASYHMQKALEKDPDMLTSKTDTVFHESKKDTTIFIVKPIEVRLPEDSIYIDSLVKLSYTKDDYITKLLNSHGINPNTITEHIKPSFDTISVKNGLLNAKIWMDNGILGSYIKTDSTMIYNLRDSVNLKDVIIERELIINTTNKVVIGKKNVIIYALIIVLVILIIIFISVLKFLRNK